MLKVMAGVEHFGGLFVSGVESSADEGTVGIFILFCFWIMFFHTFCAILSLSVIIIVELAHPTCQFVFIIEYDFDSGLFHEIDGFFLHVGKVYLQPGKIGCFTAFLPVD